ncbi:DUF2851 family protein [Paludibacter jiangxiensis]|uniref:DUF2851 domain-containing protein n=1 Tax=Paludibacter jiangxiensis TaxID=681398 RepID=A0A161LGL8_9BACT|nr:DUF2851 family protein [Paludibacter jiangxiensis]GAT64097.1 hypothetical protein PJIAN_4644 [Paludibacter jiangxiensis]
MKEALLQYAWQHKLFYAGNLATIKGKRVEVIDPGQINRDAGPDFFNAKIKIGETVWAGNVEVHINSSDWKDHHHTNDSAYNNIILHVIAKHDADIFRISGEEIEQLLLPCYEDLESRHEALMGQKSFVSCAEHLDKVPRILLSDWKNALLTERLELKVNDIETLLQNTQNNWEEAFYITLARNFGTGINSIPFELLAKSLPQIYLAKHKDNLTQIEAMLFGQSGLLNQSPASDYTDKLKQEYSFLKAKYQLQPIDAHLWKLLRLRPQNFPHVRIAQFATLTNKSSKLFSKVVNAKSIEEMESLFECSTSEYWQSHYTFNKAADSKNKAIGKSTIKILLINTAAPFLFAYGRYKNDERMQEKALTLLEQVTPEQNSIIKNWKQYNIAATSAFDSQALIHLKKHYCDCKKCLQCRIGHYVLKHDS